MRAGGDLTQPRTVRVYLVNLPALRPTAAHGEEHRPGVIRKVQVVDRRIGRFEENLCRPVGMRRIPRADAAPPGVAQRLALPDVVGRRAGFQGRAGEKEDGRQPADLFLKKGIDPIGAAPQLCHHAGESRAVRLVIAEGIRLRHRRVGLLAQCREARQIRLSFAVRCPVVALTLGHGRRRRFSR